MKTKERSYLNQLRIGTLINVPTGILTILLIFAYRHTILDALANWTVSTKVFTIIIISLSVIMVRSKYSLIKKAHFSPDLIIGPCLVLVGGLMLLTGDHTGTVSLSQISIIPVLMGMVALLWGRTLLKLTFLPILYLFFLFPVSAQLMDGFSPVFQSVTALIAYHFLDVIGYSAFLTGKLILLPHISLEVARVCSGSHHIISLMAISGPVAFWSLKRVPFQILFIALSGGVGLALNGLRVGLIGVWTHYNSDLDIHGPFSVLLISVFVVGLGTILMMAAGLLLRKYLTGSDTLDHPLIQSNMAGSENAESGKKAHYPLVVAISLLAGIIAHQVFLAPREVPFPEKMKLGLQSPGDWDRGSIVLSSGFLDGQGTENTYHYSYYRKDGSVVNLFLAWFPIQNIERDSFVYRSFLHDGKGCRPGNNGGERLGIAQVEMNGLKRVASFTYLTYGNATCSPLKAKVAIFKNALLRRRTDGAFVLAYEISDGKGVNGLESSEQLLNEIISQYLQM